MVCYVCLEECDQHSPCKCHAEIHQSCLIQMQIEMPHKNCTICHMPLDIQLKESYVDETSSEVLGSILTMFWAFGIYVLAGWIGKFFAWFVGWLQVYSFEFWSLEHFMAFIVVAGAIRVLAPTRPVEEDE